MPLIQQYPNQAGLKIGTILSPENVSCAYHFRLWDSADKLTRMFINPYTCQVMGLLQEGKNILVLPYVYIINCQQVNLDKLRLVLSVYYYL
jgi:hypothetical protein